MGVMPARAVVLLSGGMDSAVAAAEAKAAGFEVHALTVSYGQRHAVEVEAARRVGASLGVAGHRTLSVDLASFGGSALTDRSVPIPKGRDPADMASAIPATYVPARNTVLLSLALSLAESIGAFDLFIGVNAVDYSGYPDCRPEFLRAFEALAAVATREGALGRGRTRIHAPLIEMTKAAIVRRGTALGVDFSLTISCYDPDAAGRACGGCDSCVLRRKGFEEAGVPDPTVYA